mmetsp:Transcript_45483/g.97464  ORF Transcript_45483/g.97464 Transcript_45483/m.97464 type:complete len:233 (-) Transcript_45483:135-833(-)
MAVREEGSDEEILEEKDASEVQCALVEHVRGIRSRKWTMHLGNVYKVGREGSAADIEVDHPSMSRRQCSLAVTRSEAGDLVLVAMDQGSTNGTFINKSRLEKGVGLTKPLAEVKHLVFGECPNGYKIMVTQGQSKERDRSRSPKQKQPKQESWDDMAASALRMKEATKKRAEEKDSTRHHFAPPTGPSRRERRAAGAGAAGSGGSTKVPGGAGNNPTKAAKASDIEWPEDWR